MLNVEESPILIVHSISERLLTIKLVVHVFTSLSRVNISPYRTKLFVQTLLLVLDFTTLYLCPKSSKYPTSKFPFCNRFIST